MSKLSNHCANSGPAPTPGKLIWSDHFLVYETPAPGFARLDRLDDGVLGGFEVRRRMTIPRIVATADVPADQAHAQVDPGIAHLQAFFATVGIWRNDLDLCDVAAAPCRVRGRRSFAA